MHVHILGIGGTFMSALALIAKEAGFQVSGCDSNCYSPVIELLDAHAIPWHPAYAVTEDFYRADVVVVGNVLKRGMPIVEALLKHTKTYISGPEWLAKEILFSRRVIAVAGTHGKTTTTAMLVHLLNEARFEPGFLVGGVLPHWNVNARLGKGDWFVIEADEYDSAFFDKRPKFMHYRPEIAVLNNLEFDHGDIYQDLAAIEKQFHFLMRTIPENGTVIRPIDDTALDRVFKRGIYSKVITLSVGEGQAKWQAKVCDHAGAHFQVFQDGNYIGEVTWALIGIFNIKNALAALSAAFEVGVPLSVALSALSTFSPVKRRLEVVCVKNGVTLYDDFAHHPTAILGTLTALKKSERHERIFAVFEFASNTMKRGQHDHEMKHVFKAANELYVLKPTNVDCHQWEKDWPIHFIFETVDEIIATLSKRVQPGDAILVMSNRSFDNIHQKIVAHL